jgi:hypothetical protein
MGRKEKKKITSTNTDFIFLCFCYWDLEIPEPICPNTIYHSQEKSKILLDLDKKAFCCQIKCLATVEGTKKAKETSQPSPLPPPPSTPFPRERS